MQFYLPYRRENRLLRVNSATCDRIYMVIGMKTDQTIKKLSDKQAAEQFLESTGLETQSH